MTLDPRVDAYLAAQPEPQRTTLQTLRQRLHALEPELTETISYGCPAFVLGGKKVAGFAGYARHVSYLPHSGQILDGLAEHLAGYTWSKGALQFPKDQPLPDALIRLLLDARIAQN